MGNQLKSKTTIKISFLIKDQSCLLTKMYIAGGDFGGRAAAGGTGPPPLAGLGIEVKGGQLARKQSVAKPVESINKRKERCSKHDKEEEQKRTLTATKRKSNAT